MGFLQWIRGVDDRLQPTGTEESTGVPTEAEIRSALDKTRQLAREAQLHSVVLARLERVAGLIEDMLPRLEGLGAGSLDSFAVVATATDYLPEALGAYLRLPRDWADSRPVERGKTSLMLLVDQLDLLATTMDKMLDAMARADADALVAHGRFLTTRFGGAPAPVEPEPAPAATSSNPLDLS